MVNKYKNFVSESKKSADDFIDKILDKIEKDGYENLSQYEKDVMKRYSNGEDVSMEKDVEKLQREDFNKNQHRFEVGDKIRVANRNQGKLSKEVFKFLLSQKYFIIRKISSTGKLDIGCNVGGKVFYFSSDRFAHYKAPLNKLELDPHGEENWNDVDGDNDDNDNNDGHILDNNAIRFVIGNTGQEWMRDGFGPITLFAINLVNHQFGQANFMFDEEVKHYFPVLNQIHGLHDEVEGVLDYNGHLTLNQLAQRLRDLGFVVEICEDIENYFNHN